MLFVLSLFLPIFSQISPMDARESRRKKLTARILMLSMLFTMIGTLVLVIIGNQIDGSMYLSEEPSVVSR